MVPFFAERGDLEGTMRVARVCTRRQIRARDASVAHQRESLTGAGVEADRRDSLLFHFISFFSFFFLCFLFELRADDAGVRAAKLAE